MQVEIASTEATIEPGSSLRTLSRKSPIASLSRQCLGYYRSLIQVLQDVTNDEANARNFDQTTVLLRIQDAESRFRAWGSGIAAFQEIELKSSLDARLEKADEIGSRILKILSNLKESQEDGVFLMTRLLTQTINLFSFDDRERRTGK